MFESFCKEKLAPLALRLALGSVCVYHGYLKILAAGGTAWDPAFPKGWQWLIAWGEFAAGLAILVGLRCRMAAAAVLAINVGVLAWGKGWELFRLPVASLEPTVVLLLVTLSLLFLGGGGLSLDGKGAPTRRALKP